ncbi:MAG TPA: DUF362 domain-containing protein [Magnetospirillaceae bacterium]|nr:DUF362 domain-containing protein [Magnetospirillaceae bacterium]
MATVTVERLPRMDTGPARWIGGFRDAGYLSGCAALPRDYGTAAWESRPEVRAVRDAVFSALDRLDAEAGISERFKGRPVLVKPNLVTVYQDMGLTRRVYPETTDPRVLDAVVLWLSGMASSISIVESSGRGAATRGSYRVSGVDRLARARGCDLVALEETPVDRYFLPGAAVQREVYLPRPFSEVIRGGAAYVSVPKLKTNLYTVVTLGFKNAMGVLPYNLRQRAHHYALERKLVETLRILRPDLVLIDGVVGGEGECPAPVDPVDSRMVIAGDHPVETDRVAARLMGFDPRDIPLLREADGLGFGSPEPARVLARGFGAGVGDPDLGGACHVYFRPADWNPASSRVRERLPGFLVLLGIDRAGGAAGPDPAESLAAACRGGCVATTRFALAMMEAEGVRPRFPVAVILGPGVESGGRRLWYDGEGRAWDEKSIRDFPGRRAVIGSCSRGMEPSADRFVDGCMVLPNGPHMVLHDLAGAPCRVVSFRNRNLLTMLAALMGARLVRRRLLKAGERLDAPLQLDDRPDDGPILSTKESTRDWIPWPAPAPGRAEIRRLLRLEDEMVAASLRGTLSLHARKLAREDSR